MTRGETGRFEVTTLGGEEVRAFIPVPLPPVPRIELDGPLLQTRGTGRLGSSSSSWGSARRQRQPFRQPGV